MDTFFGLLSHATIILGVVAQFYIICLAISRADNSLERIVRTTALTTGLLIFFGAKALDMSLSDLLLLGITQYSPVKFGFYGIVVPSFLGYFLAWYFIRQIKKSTDLTTRIMILTGVFTVLQFSEVYLKAMGIGGIPLNKSVVPNLVFTISIGLYVTLKYEHTARTPKSQTT